MPKVYNKRDDDIPDGAVDIMRPGKWGNPLPMLGERDRQKCIRRFEDYLRAHPRLLAEAKHELKGRDLVCTCKPKDCHGDVLLRIANEP
jgi:hypothetical protein